MSTENQTEQITEQPKVRKQRSDKGVSRGPYKPRKEKPTLNEIFLGNALGVPVE